MIVLLFTMGSVLIATRFPRKLGKPGNIAVTLISTSLLVLIIPNLFSKYTLDIVHVFTHALFNLTFLSYTLVIQQFAAHLVPTNPGLENRVPISRFDLSERSISFSDRVYRLVEIGLFDKIQYTVIEEIASLSGQVYHIVEIGLFDKIQYLFARGFVSFSNIFRRIQTGNLNLNMLALLLFLLFSLLLLHLWGSPALTSAERTVLFPSSQNGGSPIFASSSFRWRFLPSSARSVYPS